MSKRTRNKASSASRFKFVEQRLRNKDFCAILNLPQDIAKIFDDADYGGRIEAYNDVLKVETIGTTKNFSLPRFFTKGKTSKMRQFCHCRQELVRTICWKRALLLSRLTKVRRTTKPAIISVSESKDSVYGIRFTSPLNVSTHGRLFMCAAGNFMFAANAFSRRPASLKALVQVVSLTSHVQIGHVQ